MVVCCGSPSRPCCYTHRVGRALLGVVASVVTGVCLGVGCVPSEFRCEVDGQCGADGLCEPTGFCSELDPSCESGRRYAPLSGSLSDECVADDAASSGVDTAASAATTASTGPSSTSDNPFTGPSSSSAPTTQASQTSIGETGVATLEFIDQLQADFEAGTLEDVIWEEGLTLPAGGAAGRFVSQVFDAGVDVTWTRVDWLPAGPYSKALPSDGVSEQGYDRGNADLTGNVLLLHFDEDVTLSALDPVVDASPLGLPANADGSAPLSPIPGMFGGAMSIAPTGFVTVPTESTDAFQFGGEGYTWSMWARTESACSEGTGNASNQVFLGIEDPFDIDSSHLWLGCKNPSTSQCPDGAALGHPGGTQRPHILTSGDGVFCGDSELVGTGWHHMAMVKEAAAGNIVLWYDGSLETSVSISDPSPVVFETGPPFTVGSLSGGYFSEFDVDEVAIFNRALDPGEVVDLYRRGALRLGIRVRACALANCEDEPPFVGQDVSPFVDSSLPPGEVIDLVGVGPTRYFQYEVELAGAPHLRIEAAPILQRVTIQATR